MSASRWGAAVVVAFALASGAVAPASASANTIQTTVMIKPSAPLLGDPLGGVQTIVSNLVGATTQAVCKLTGIQTLCTLNVLSYGIATDYKRPDGTHVVKVTGGVINVPTFVDST